MKTPGLPMEDGVRLATVGVMDYEHGHVYADAVSLPPSANWLSEFFADFLWVAYFTDGSAPALSDLVSFDIPHVFLLTLMWSYHRRPNG